MMDSSTRLALRTDNIAATIIDGEAVIINLSTGVYYSLIGAGVEAWRWIEQGHALGAVAEALASRYETSPEQTAADVSRLAEEMLKEELVCIAETTAEAAAIPPATGGKIPYQAPALEAYRDMEDLLALDPPMPGLRDVPWQPTGPK